MSDALELLRSPSPNAELDGLQLFLVESDAMAVGSTTIHGSHISNSTVFSAANRAFPLHFPHYGSRKLGSAQCLHRRLQSHPSFQPQSVHPCCRSYPLVSHHRVGSSQGGADAPLEAGVCDAMLLRFVAARRTQCSMRAPKQVSGRHRAPLRRELPLLHTSWSLLDRYSSTSCCKYYP
jgi:hypothetical protein